MTTQIQVSPWKTRVMNKPEGFRAFFLTVIPGLEMTAYLELCEKWRLSPDFFLHQDLPEVEFYKGGIEFKAPLHAGLLLNKYLKVPTRILLREKEFEAPDIKVFKQNLKSIKWSQYFKQGSTFDLSFSSKSSKLSMKKQMEKVFDEELRGFGLRLKKGSPTIFVRLFRDKCNISLDTTGERAQFRGVEKKVSMASLRESTAAGLLRNLLQGIRGEFHLVDPMCGSGTFLTETMTLHQPMGREFAFQKFPIMDKVKDTFEKQESLLTKTYGYDFHPKALTVAKNNLKSFDKAKWSLEQKDLFKNEYKLDEASQRVVIVNPPWGKRLPAASHDFVWQIEQKLKPQRLGLLMPAHWKVGKTSMELVRDIPILNSGVENRFLVFIA